MTAARTPVQRAVWQALNTKLIPWTRGNDLRLMAATSNWLVPAGVQMAAREDEIGALPSHQRFSLSIRRWRELGLNDSPYPCLLYILEGEADIKLVLPPGTLPTSQHTVSQSEIQVCTLPEGSCLVIPPGVPFSDGSKPHWEKPFPETAHSQIFWLKILPNGAMLHICRTQGLVHTHSSVLFVKDAQVSTLMLFLLEKLASTTQADAVVNSYLHTFLLCIEQSWAAGHILEDDVNGLSEAPEQGHRSGRWGAEAQSAALERACQYIQSHLIDAMSAAQIARHAYVSVPQLKRIFRAELNTSVMKYVTQRRLEEAKNLLQGTGLTIQEIGVICGYPHRTHFSRVFKAQFGSSPNAFRRLQKTRDRTEAA